MSLGCSYRHLAFKVSEEELPQFEKIMNAFSKTALCANRKYLPPIVAQAVALANDLGFIHCCIPEQGALLRVLARGRAGGVIGETGTERGTNP